MNYEEVRFWLEAAQLIGTIIVGIYVWWSNREKVTNKRFAEHGRIFEQHDKRLITLEAKKDQHPECPHHDGFEVRLDALHGDIRELSGGVKGLTRAVDLMNEFLINNGRGKL